MKLIDKEVICKNRTEPFFLYAVGDIHLGSSNCAESQVRRLIGKINKTKNALWLGGGDYCECIKPSDIKRFDIEGLPDWMLGPDTKQFFKDIKNVITEEDAAKVLRKYKGKVRRNLRDIVSEQRKRLIKLFEPIKDKCLGLLEGNHEEKMRRYHNLDHHGFVCNHLQVEDLTSEALLRLRFKRDKSIRVIKIFACHGHGGGRTAGAEPNHLFRLSSHWQVDIVLRGHSHTFCINPPLVELGVPNIGELPKECMQFYKRAGNWGCWLKSYAAGPSTYVTRKTYPPRPLSTLEIEILPHAHSHNKGPEIPLISMKELVV